MNELVNPFGQIDHSQSFDRIGISIASSESIRSWSFGEIKKPETKKELKKPEIKEEVKKPELKKEIKPKIEAKKKKDVN